MSISGIEQNTGSMQEMMSLMQGPPPKEGANAGSIEDMFSEIDQDGSGDLSEDEITAMQEKMQQGQEMMAMMQDIGMQMESGQSGAGAEAGSGGGDPLSSILESLTNEDSFDVMDSDEDGVVSSEEFAEYMGTTGSATTSDSSGQVDMKKNLMQQAIAAYQQSMQESDAGLDLIS